MPPESSALQIGEIPSKSRLLRGIWGLARAVVCGPEGVRGKGECLCESLGVALRGRTERKDAVGRPADRNAEVPTRIGCAGHVCED